MATISNRALKITHDHRKNTANPVVTCTVRFSTLELCQMKNCPEARLFKLKCQLWGADISVGEWWRGSDDYLYTYNDVNYFPDPTPSASEPRTFDVTVGEGLLDEDWLGTDEIYGLLLLYNLLTGTVIKKRTNVVSHSF